MKVHTYDDITGDGAKHQLTSLLKINGVAVSLTSLPAKWWQATMVTTSGVSRVGDSNVSSTNGTPLGSGSNIVAQFAPIFSEFPENYELADVWVLINNGDVMAVARGI
jgi:hypothetical protein